MSTRAMLRTALTALTWVCTAALAQQCPSTPLCRATAPDGALMHKPNSAGALVWTTNCQQPNTSQRRDDQICREIVSCPAAGGFGKFLRSVTFDCKVKHFDGYFGLDGMTYGILDWTANNLPETFQAYQTRNASKFDEIFGDLDLPMKNGCLSSKWACRSNKDARLMCDAKFREAFKKGLSEADFQKAQVDLALRAYEARLKRFASLGLKTEYGNIAMAVVANNLLNNERCRPASWKISCSPQENENKLVDCMLDKYVANACRGSSRGSKERADAIKKIFDDALPSTALHPSPDEITGCSAKWGVATAK